MKTSIDVEIFMYALCLEDAVRAAWSLHLMPDFSDRASIKFHRLHEAGGMTPWLRLALGDSKSREIERAGEANFNLGWMFGMPDGGRSMRPILLAPPDEAFAIRIVDRLCTEAPDTKVNTFLRFCVDPVRGTSAEAFLRPMRDAVEEDITAGYQPISAWTPSILLAMADHIGIVLDERPADLSMWMERRVDVTVVGLVPAKSGYFGTLANAYAVLQYANGSQLHLHDTRGTQMSGSHLYSDDLKVGSRLRLSFAGSTSGHPGYLVHVEDYALIELMANVRDFLCREEAAAAFEVRMANGNHDAEGHRLGEGNRVQLVTSCLEAPKGAEGEVDELLGDIVVVDFGGTIGLVPCYPDALRLTEVSAHQKY